EAGGVLATITATRTGGSDGTVTVGFATANGTATAGSDYSAASGTLTFGPGVTSQSFTVPVLDDGGSEGDQAVNLALTGPGNGAALGGLNTAVLTIHEPGAGQSLQFSAPTYTVTEAGGVLATVTVTRS